MKRFPTLSAFILAAPLAGLAHAQQEAPVVESGDETPFEHAEELSAAV